LDHVVIRGEAHLRRVLKSYADYYNSVRTHRSLNKDAPVSRSAQRTGVISSRAILGGLHHHHARVQVFGTHSGDHFLAAAPTDTLSFEARCTDTKIAKVLILLVSVFYICWGGQSKA
jgi:hypothetical protein